MTTTLKDFTDFYTALINHQGLTKQSVKALIATQIRIRSRSQFGPLAKIDSMNNDNIELGYGLGVDVLTRLMAKLFLKKVLMKVGAIIQFAFLTKNRCRADD